MDEELERVVPVIEGIKREYPSGLISIDTYKAEVARAAVAAGANMVTTRRDRSYALIPACPSLFIIPKYTLKTTSM